MAKPDTPSSRPQPASATPPGPLWRRMIAAADARFPKAMEKGRAYVASLPLPTSRRERQILGGLAIAITLTLTLPFLLRPAHRPLIFGRADTELTILTPHNETIRREFGEAFEKWFKKRTGKTVHLDWRTPGGTSEIVKVIGSEYHAAFENYWRKHGTMRWQEAFGRTFNDPKVDRKPGATEPATPAQEAREMFLRSNVGIGVDLFFGGGTFEFEKQARAGTIVAADASGKYGFAALKRQQPDWFTDAIIPQSVSGEPYYDPNLTWVGSCLSSFGIVYNRDTVARLGLDPPRTWEDLADPRYYGQIAVADPAKSGSIVKAFEMIVQQQMRRTLEAAKPRIEAAPPRMRQDAQEDALREGWIKGLQLLQRIGANARYFTDNAAKVPQDVAKGVAAAGMCIDFYGRTFNERLRKPDGSSRIDFIAPAGGTSTGVDAIAMFRGAPHPEVAHLFLEFVLSPDGQAIWNFRPGTPGGPRRTALRRLPVRKDMYVPNKLAFFSDPEVLPYSHAHEFVFEPSWTTPKFAVLQLGVRVMCIDTNDELRETWKLLIAKNFPPNAMAQFTDMRPLAGNPAYVTESIRGDKLTQVKFARNLGAQFRRSYKLARLKAEQ